MQSETEKTILERKQTRLYALLQIIFISNQFTKKLLNRDQYADNYQVYILPVIHVKNKKHTVIDF